MRLVLLCMLITVVTVSAQDQVLSLQQGTLRDWTMQKDTMMKISAAMPGDKFTFKPTPPQRNFGEQVLHVVEANVNQINRLGSKVPAPAYNMKETDRAEILKRLLHPAYRPRGRALGNREIPVSNVCAKDHRIMIEAHGCFCRWGWMP